jgi:hypothetical protein
MNTYLSFSAVFLGLLEAAIYTSAQLPDAAMILSCFVSAFLAAWAGHQYGRKFLPLSRGKVLRLTSRIVPRGSFPASSPRYSSKAAGF